LSQAALRRNRRIGLLGEFGRESMDERELLRGTLARARRALQFLEQQAAGFGLLHIPANLQIELE